MKILTTYLCSILGCLILYLAFRKNAVPNFNEEDYKILLGLSFLPIVNSVIVLVCCISWLVVVTGYIAFILCGLSI